MERGTIVGGYRVEGVLGRGGMAYVYRARHVDSDRPVALKVIAADLAADPEFAARFRREGRLQASLEHPHVVTVYEAGESEHGLYLAMRLVNGSTLAALLGERALDAARSLDLLGQVAGALDAAHAAGLVHRDVKPQNVLVGDADDAYLGDFGLTRLGGEAGATATGKLVGTVAYLAPEVIRGEDAVPASDRYAFAAVIFLALTGTLVFPRQSAAAVLHAHTNEPVPRASRRRAELPAELDDIFERALSKDPGERPQSAVALVEEVAETIGRAGVGDLAPPPPPGVGALEGSTVEPLTPGAHVVSARRPRPALLALLATAALVSAAVAAGIALALDDGGRGGDAAAAAPSPLAGATILGSDLRSPGRPLDCRGRPPALSSGTCTVVQTKLAGKAVVVPQDGVIRRWAVRSARGELALVVVRSRGTGGKQVARSENEFAGSDGSIHAFPTDLEVRQGDLLGVVTVPGAGVGVRTAGGAATKRWMPRLQGTQPARFGPGTGFDRELLLRVEEVPGAKQRKPPALTGAAARDAPAGTVRVRRKLRYGSGRRVEIALVRLGKRFVLDEFIGGRRTARTEVPDFRPSGGRLLDFEAYAEDADPQTLGVYMEWANEESARILNHFYSVFPREFDFID